MSFRAREDVAHHILKQHPGQALSKNRSQQPSKSSSAPQHEQKQMVNAPEEVNDHDNEGNGYHLGITMWFLFKLRIPEIIIIFSNIFKISQLKMKTTDRKSVRRKSL